MVPAILRAHIVERLAGDEIDRTGNAAVDHVGGGVLEDFDAAQQFGRDVVERQRTAAIGGEDVAAVQFRTHEGQAANDHARTFDREAIGVVALFEAADIDAGHALQRFGNRTVGQGADVFGGDDVDERVGIALDALGVFQRGAEATDDDDTVFVHDTFGRTAGGFLIAYILRQRRSRQ